MLIAVGSAMQIAGMVFAGSDPAVGLVGVFWIGTALLAIGMAYYAKSKGHSPAFCVAALGSVVGLIFVALLGDRSAAQNGQRQAGTMAFARQAAKASWVAPLVAFAVSLGIRASVEDSATASMVRLIADLVLVGGGLILGIVALCSVRRHGREGILRPAIIGVTINLLLILGGVGTLIASTPMKRWQAERDAMEALHDYPGWYGGAAIGEAMVGVASWDDRSTFAAEFNAVLGANVSILSIAVDNSRGEDALTVDLSSVRLHLADGSVQRALRTGTILATSREQVPDWLAKCSGPVQLAPGTQFPRGVAFLPHGFDMSKVVSIAMRVDGQDTTIEGSYMTGQQKAELYRLGLERRQEAGTPGGTEVVVQKSSGILGEQKVIMEALGIETLGGVFAPIIEVGCRAPFSQTELFSTAVDNQDQIEIALYRGNAKLTRDNAFLGRFAVYEIPLAPRGVPKIAITLTVSTDGDIILTAKDETGGEPIKMGRIEP